MASPGSAAGVAIAAAVIQPEEKATAEEETQPEVWVQYVCRSIDFGAEHPGHLVEASVLAATPLPQATYPLQESLEDCIRRKALSRMQLEGIMFACQRFQQKIHQGTVRAGFYLGDSAGVGKGRQISGIILDSLVRGRDKHCWFSVSADLYIDATRDLRDIGCMVSVIPNIAGINELVGTSKYHKPAVCFSTYMGLISQGSLHSSKDRMDELVEWLCDGKPASDYEGVIVFDEAHKAKNYREGDTESTKMGDAVHLLQETLPNARILYASATCVSHVEDMQYMTRLGYWGPGTQYETFAGFRNVISKADVTGMEILAVDMKNTGRAMVRNVSYQGAEFIMSTSNLSPENAKIYRVACQFWDQIRDSMMMAKKLCLNGGDDEEEDDEDEEEQVMQHEAPAPAVDAAAVPALDGKPEVKKRKGPNLKMITAQYWGSHQRFFAQLILALKVERIVLEVKQALARGMCAVIGLQSTGGAALHRALEDEGLNGDEQSDSIISVCKSIARLFLRTQFPTIRNFKLKPGMVPFYQPNAWEMGFEITLMCRKNRIDLQLVKRIFGFAFDAKANRECAYPMFRTDDTVVEAVRMRDKLLEKLDTLDFPPCALDNLIDQLGGPTEVAEMTGRSIRQVRLPNKNKFVVESRAAKAVDVPQQEEKDQVLGKRKWWADSVNIQTDSLNVQERGSFLRGEKLVAVISAAASTGISLHADRNVPNQKRRFHCTLELPWAADQAIQQLGRSHRTNQSSAPLFCLMSSGLGGENRFVSSVAKRLQSLGAITQGDRRASLGAMSLGEFQFESIAGTKALKQLFADCGPNQKFPKLVEGVEWKKVVAESLEFVELDLAAQALGASAAFYNPSRCKTSESFLQMVQDGLRALDMEKREVATGEVVNPLENPLRKKKKKSKKDPFGKNSVTKFLNRILGLPFAHQTLLFNYFSAILEAKLRGSDMGFLSLAGDVRRAQPRAILYKDLLGRPVYLERLMVETYMDFPHVVRELRYLVALANDLKVVRESFAVNATLSDAQMQQLLQDAKDHKHQFYIRSERHDQHKHFWILLNRGSDVAGNSKNKVYYPFNGTGQADRADSDFGPTKMYRPSMDLATIRRFWNTCYEHAIKPPENGEQYREKGEKPLSIITGSLMPVLSSMLMVEGLSEKQKLRAYLTTTTDGERILGLEPHNIDKFIAALQVQQAHQNRFELTFNSVPTLMPRLYDFGFDIDRTGTVKRVSAKMAEVKLKEGHVLVSINDNLFRHSRTVNNFHDAVEYYLTNSYLMEQGQGRQAPEHIMVSVKFSRPEEDVTDAPIEDFTDKPAPVSFLTMQSILTNPKKVRKSIEKIEKKVSKMFDSDSEEEDAMLKQMCKSNGLKRNASSTSATTTASKKKRQAVVSSASTEEDDSGLDASAVRRVSSLPTTSSSSSSSDGVADTASGFTATPSVSAAAKKLVFQATPASLGESSIITPARMEVKSSSSTLVAAGLMRSASSPPRIAGATTTTTSKKPKVAATEAIELLDDDMLNFNFRKKN